MRRAVRRTALEQPWQVSGAHGMGQGPVCWERRVDLGLVVALCVIMVSCILQFGVGTKS